VIPAEHNNLAKTPPKCLCVTGPSKGTESASLVCGSCGVVVAINAVVILSAAIGFISSKQCLSLDAYDGNASLAQRD